ncbi:MAG: hypothetical protein RL523_1131 [Actinomycetota bacterium]|jgi:uncharacterized membrane protein YdbT with pleckstrin-like domain
MNTVNSNFAEEQYAIVRSSSGLLLLPLILLAVSSALYIFLSSRFTEALQQQILLVGIASGVFFFWLIPSLRYLSNRSVLSSNRVVVRTGLFGTKQQTASWGEFTGVSLQRGFFARLNRAGNIHLHREFGVDLVIPRVPNAKKLTRELERFLASRVGMGQ